MKWLRFPRTLGIVVCVYLTGMSAVFGLLSWENYRFTSTAHSTTATVIALVPRAPVGSTRETRSGRATSLAPTVRYEVAGTPYTYTAAHGSFRQSLRVGDTVTVIYDPQHPATARLRGEGRVLIPLITAGFVTSALLVAAILVRTRNLGVRPERRRTTSPTAKQVVKQAARAP